MMHTASLGDIAEGMEVFGSDGALVGAVRVVWGGLTTLWSAIGADRATGGASPVGADPEVSDLPSGTAPLGENAPGYIEVEALATGSPRTIYIPLSDVTDIKGGRLTLTRTAAEAMTGTYDRYPSG